MEEFKPAYPLIHNKVTSPRYVTPTLRRARLLDWLHANSEARAVVIAAGAGYGKTTLLWQWEQEVDFPCYWYKLDRNDRDWTLHISYLVEAVSQRHPGFGRRAHSILRQMGGPGTSRPGVTAFLLAEMHERLREPCTFIIDDWQCVASVTEVRGLWNQILRDAPPTCRFVFASRGKPHLQFARFKTHGGYAEIRTDELRLTEPEITELFRDVYRDPLTQDEARELERRTEGWAASLQLVEVSLRERRTPEERRALIESITATSDSDLFAFLAEEVLEQQTEETRNFLLSTSILQQITPELAERLAGVQDGTRRLMQLEHAGLFTERLDEARYRYHGLFRDFLERRLEDDRSDAEVTGLHIHAASYYETSTQWPDAIYHYLKAGLQRQAARLIARYGEEVVGEGRLGLVDSWLQELPEKAIRDNARLSLLHGEALGIRGEFDRALAALERARTFFSRKGDRRMQALAQLKESSLYHHWGRPETAYRAATSGLALMPADDQVLRLRLEGNIAITSLWLHSPFPQVLRALMRLTAEASQMGLEHYAAIGLHNVGDLQLEMGQVDRSIKSLERAAEFWNQLPANPFGDNYNLTRAYVASGNTKRALELAQLGVMRTRNWRLVNTEARCGLAVALCARDEFEGALDALRPAVLDRSNVGSVAEDARLHFLKVSILGGNVTSEAEVVAALIREQAQDPRLEAERAVVLELFDHVRGRCDTTCGLASLKVASSWAARGARLIEVSSAVMVSRLLLDHARPNAPQRAVDSILAASSLSALRSLRGWLRPLGEQLAPLAAKGGFPLLAELVQVEPRFWIPRLPDADIAHLGRTEVDLLVGAIERNATADAIEVVSRLPGPDFQALRSRLIHRQAPRLFVQTLGKLEVRRGTWTAASVPMHRRRTRALLGLLAAHPEVPISRDAVLDTLWPEADPAAAINSLNQTLFQLRREIDPSFKAGQSPEYVLTTADALQLSPDLVKVDWVEVAKGSNGMWTRENAHKFVVHATQLVQGEFLPEAQYDDWSYAHRRRIHDQLREALLPMATDVSRSANDRAKLARAAIALDAFDETAHVALARAFSDSGRRAAGLKLLRDFARRLSDEFDEAPSADLGAAADGLR